MIVYNGATMDLLHSGHLYVVRQMRALAGPHGKVVIGLNTDEFVRAFKGHQPVQSLDERMEIVGALRDVDSVVVNWGGADSKPVLETVRPDIIAVGHDWYSPDDALYCRQMGFTRKWLEEHRIRLHYMDWLPGRSSTNLRSISARIFEAVA